MSDSTDPPAPQPWKRPVRPEVPHQPGAFELTEGRKKLLWSAGTAVVFIGAVAWGFLSRVDDTPDPGSPAALASPEVADARSRSLKRLGDQFQATVTLNETDAHLTRIEAAVEKLRVILDRPGPGLDPAEYEQVTGTTSRSLDTLQERLTVLLKTDLTADQSSAARRHLERVELIRCTLVGMAPRE
jgi:hypothetical protein